MSETAGGPRAAGWMYADGDPPGTVRYWNGQAWQGDPRPVSPPAQVGGSPAPKGSKTTRNVLLVLGIGVAAIVALSAVNGVMDRRAVDQAGDDFMQAFADSDSDRIEALLDSSCWSDDDIEEVVTWSAADDIASFDLDRRTMGSSGGTPTAGLGGTITFSGERGSEDVPVLLTFRGANGWLVCQVQIGDAVDTGGDR